MNIEAPPIVRSQPKKIEIIRELSEYVEVKLYSPFIDGVWLGIGFILAPLVLLIILILIGLFLTTVGIGLFH